MRLIPVILAGGTGSRLWPLSRALFPKQFHALLSDQSMLQQTLSRAASVCAEAPVIVCNEEHRFLVAEQCRALGSRWSHLILEPEGRNTAPAIALAAHACRAVADDALMLVLPSDHLIREPEAFAAAVAQAQQAAEQGGLVTFGIKPVRAETGYGYIETAAPDCARESGTAVAVRSFVEKPDQARAEEYLASGAYLWNSGMFLLGAGAYLQELERHNPDLAAAVQTAFGEGSVDLDFFRPGRSFLNAPSISIDYAVMEKTDRAMVVPVSCGWSDVGSWSAMWEASEQDEAGNHFQGDVLAVGTTGSYVRAEDRLVGTVGVSNLVVVETADAVLIADKDQVQDVKLLVDRLKASAREEFVSHREVFRPWGSFEAVGQGERYQVKRIKVKPGERLSLQMHHH
ncbi:MAG: mannose-1-phosphate guanylyltransferase/mannose-6-phosphate isomerase, partial [Pseudomonadales bacterium]|nr:mannose-1-phosphate guanylyltransferase/mannose-6-phosphate isomerase [Pseudomonadales bacterium]